MGDQEKKEEIYLKSFLSVLRKGRTKLIIALIVLCIPLFVADSMHQKELANLSTAYVLMNQGDYKSAMTVFESYLRHGRTYFILNDFVNGKESQTSEKSVSEALENCRKRMGIIDGE